MAIMKSPGFCGSPCEIDTYQEATTEMSSMLAVADVTDPNPDEKLSRTIDALQVVSTFQLGIVEDCKGSAATLPCEGYLEEGVTLWLTGTPVVTHCPLVARKFAGAVE